MTGLDETLMNPMGTSARKTEYIYISIKQMGGVYDLTDQYNISILDNTVYFQYTCEAAAQGSVQQSTAD